MKKRDFIKRLGAEEYARIKAMSDEERAVYWKEVMTTEHEARIACDPILSRDKWFEMLEEADDKVFGSHHTNQRPKSDKFHNVPEDGRTQIIFEAKVKFEDFDVLFQHWEWGGIEGESLIFVASDVAYLSDEELLKKVEESAINTVKSGLTIIRNTHGYTFVNLNFKVAG